MRIAPLAFILAASLGSLPARSAGQAQAPGQAQATGQRCEIQSASSSTRGTTLRDEGRTFMGGGVFFECAGGTTIRSDSLARFEAAGMIEFFGNVHYADTAKTLSAEYVRYIGGIGQVIAQDSVVLTDIESGSQIRAPYLEYFQATETRPEALVRIPSGRPRAILISGPADSLPQPEDRAAVARNLSPPRGAADTMGAATPGSPDAIPSAGADVTEAEPPDTTLIDADAMDFYGQRLAVARGNVVVLRDDMQAFGDELHFDQRADSLLMTGSARVVTDERQVHGDTIAALITPERELRQVNAWRNARLESEDLEAEAPGLRILLENGEVHRMIALGDRAGSRGGLGLDGLDETMDPEDPTDPVEEPDRPPGRGEEQTPPTPAPRPPDALLPGSLQRPANGSPGVQARVTAEDVRMVGDSIDALAPGQQLDRVIAVGAAFGERITTDTVVVRPAIAENDWMTGDTIIATFAPAPDTAAPEAEAPDPTAALLPGAAAADSTDRPERVLESLTAIADSTSDARSLYAVANEEDPAEPPALNYLIAQRIHVTLRDGVVLDVSAVGRDGKPVHGVYLQAKPDSARTPSVAQSEREP